MKRLTTILALSIASTVCIADSQKQFGTDNPGETVRLIITGDPNIGMTQSTSQLSSATVSPGGLRTIEVKESEAEGVIELLKRQPGVKYVERDILVSTPRPVKSAGMELSQGSSTNALSGSQPNDPEFPNQHAWKDVDPVYKGHSNILEGFKQSVLQEKVRIGMTDSGFYDREDINYSGGYNFATYDGGVVGPAFYEDQHNPSCDSPHGGSVAHIIGANTDNNVGVAGIVDADLYAARVMNCGTGFLSEMATGIRWLAKDPSLSSDIVQIDAPVDIINVSMGGQISYCPNYVQSAIDYAYNKGIAIFVAAGNDSIDAAGYTPANCKNVITVGSVDRTGQQSSFTNYGAKVDMSALGELVRSEGTSGYSYWFGTSFSTPNTVGMAGLAKQANPGMTPDHLYSYVKSTTNSYSPGQAPDGLGTGVADAKALVESVNADLGIDTPILKPVLEMAGRCNNAAYQSAAYLDDTNQPILPCGIFELNASLQTPPPGQDYRTLFRIPQGQSFGSASPEVVKASQQERFVVYNLDPQAYDYGFALCNSDASICETPDPIPLNDDDLDPATYCKP